jgi:hypothetical protein
VLHGVSKLVRKKVINLMQKIFFSAGTLHTEMKFRNCLDCVYRETEKKFKDIVKVNLIKIAFSSAAQNRFYYRNFLLVVVVVAATDC